MIETLTTVLVLATLAYTYLTYRILRANQQNIEVMKEQSLALTRPYIDIFAAPESETPLFILRIKNNGITAAKNLRLRMDRSFFQYGKNDPDHDVSRFRAFRETILSFAPKAEISFYLAQSFVVFGDDADAEITPASFSITAEYEFGDQRVEECTTVDLQPYRNSAIPIDRGLDKLSKSLDKIREAVTKS